MLLHQILIKKNDFTSLKTDIDNLEKVPSGLGSLKSKVDELDFDKLATTPVDLHKLIVKKVLKNDVYNELVNKVNAI